jgi:hypothetical protein
VAGRARGRGAAALRPLSAITTGALAALLACNAPPAYDPADVQLIAELRDYRVDLNAVTLRAGPQRIGVRNPSGQVHELNLIRTDLAPDKLPYDPGRAVAVEDGLVGETKPIRSGGTARLDLVLEPGKYVVICNTPGHYQLGMRTALSVESAP